MLSDSPLDCLTYCYSIMSKTVTQWGWPVGLSEINCPMGCTVGLSGTNGQTGLKPVGLSETHGPTGLPVGFSETSVQGGEQWSFPELMGECTKDAEKYSLASQDAGRELAPIDPRDKKTCLRQAGSFWTERT